MCGGGGGGGDTEDLPRNTSKCATYNLMALSTKYHYTSPYSSWLRLQ